MYIGPYDEQSGLTLWSCQLCLCFWPDGRPLRAPCRSSSLFFEISGAGRTWQLPLIPWTRPCLYTTTTTTWTYWRYKFIIISVNNTYSGHATPEVEHAHQTQTQHEAFTVKTMQHFICARPSPRDARWWLYWPCRVKLVKQKCNKCLPFPSGDEQSEVELGVAMATANHWPVGGASNAVRLPAAELTYTCLFVCLFDVVLH